MLPFDLLLLPVHHSFKLALSASHSSHIRAAGTPSSSSFSSSLSSSSSSSSSRRQRLRYGFISYDINNHPTAHLLEAIFRIIRDKRKTKTETVNDSDTFPRDNDSHELMRKKDDDDVFRDVELIIFSYGFDDKSVYRRRLQQVTIYFI